MIKRKFYDINELDSKGLDLPIENDFRFQIP